MIIRMMPYYTIILKFTYKDQLLKYYKIQGKINTTQKSMKHLDNLDRPY